MTVRLILVCHASTAATRAAAFGDDDPLDEPGRAKAAQLAATARLDGEAWCAPSRPARETALALGIQADDEPALRDCDFGCWRGQSLGDVSRREPEAVTQWLTDPSAAPHGGESVTDVIQRVGRWLEGLGGPQSERRTVVAVTHPSVVRAAVVGALGASPASFWRIDAVPLSRTELRGRAGRWNLRSLSVS
jgi:broad specificity phosphatase PhoE